MDRKHLQGRVQHFLEARLSNQRATARPFVIEEENGELEILQDVIEEADTFKSTKMERREVRRDRDFAMAEGGRQARMLAMERQAPVDESDEERDVHRAENISDGENRMNELQKVGRECRSSTPVSVAQRNIPTQDNEDVQIMKLLQTSASAISSQASRVYELEERKLRLEEARIEREGEIATRRIKLEEDGEARLQRNEDRQAQMEEIRISSRKAQTDLMLRMLEIVQNKLL
jgi:hypothetical protein